MSGHIDVHHIHDGGGDTGSLDARLAAMDLKLDALRITGAQLMALRQEDHALLDQINTYTNKLATQQEADAAKLQEISDDIDALIAGTTDPTLTARLQSHADALATIAANDEARAATLTALAAKHETPLPPPVEPTEPV